MQLLLWILPSRVDVDADASPSADIDDVESVADNAMARMLWFAAHDEWSSQQQ